MYLINLYNYNIIEINKISNVRTVISEEKKIIPLHYKPNTDNNCINIVIYSIYNTSSLIPNLKRIIKEN